MFVIVSEFVWYSLVSGSIQMAIFTLQHMCVKYCRRLLRGILKHVFFSFLKKIIFFPKLVRLCYLYGSSFVWTDFSVSMPLSWFLSCWARWFALNILLSILYCRDKLRGNEPLHRNAVSVKSKNYLSGSKRVYSHVLICHQFCPWCVWPGCMKSVSEHHLKTSTGSVYKHWVGNDFQTPLFSLSTILV